MAYTKVFAIRARLDDRVKYAVNGEKTELRTSGSSTPLTQRKPILCAL